MSDKKRIESFAQAIMKKSNADETHLMVQGWHESLTRFSNNEVTQNVDSQKHSFVLRVVYGGKTGIVSGTNPDSGKAADYLKMAKEIAMHQREKKNMLPLIKNSHTYKKMNNFDKKTENVPPEKRIDKVKKAIMMVEKSKLKCAGIISSQKSTFAIANSSGVFAFDESTAAEFSITVMSKNSSGWAEDYKKSFDKINVEKKTEKAIDICKKAKNPYKLEPGKYTVILEPAATAGLISFLSYGVFNTQRYIEGRSFLTGRKGEKIVNEKINISDDPYIENASGLPFDFEGFPKQRVELIKNGKFINLVHDRKTAKALKEKYTGHSLGPDDNFGPMPLNLVIMPGNNSLKEMINSTKKGILVTHLHYINMLDPMKTTITGMTRDGLFLVENGKIKKGIKNFRFTQSIVESLNNVAMIGNDNEMHEGGFWGGFYVSSMKIDKFNFTSITDF